MKTYKAFSKEYCLVESEVSAQNGKHFEGAFTQGSGYMHMRASYEEGLECAPQCEEYMRLPANVTVEQPRHTRSKFGVYIPGVTGSHPLLREEIANLPYLAKLCIKLNGEALDMDNSNTQNYRRVLDMRDAVLYRSFSWSVNDAKIMCSYHRYISRHEKNLLIIKAQYTAISDVELEITSEIQTDVRTNGYNHFVCVTTENTNKLSTVKIKTDTGDEVLMAALLIVDGKKVEVSQNKAVYITKLKKGDSICVCKYAAALTSRDSTSQSFEALSTQLNKACENNHLYESHAKAWEKMWRKSAIKISGDDEAQAAVNFSIYHLLRSANENDSRTAICAKGFAGEAYFGHYFWDTEIYLLPFFLYTNPKTAHALMQFRINTLQGAQRNAMSYGYQGAKYAWESSVSGDEQCPNWQYCDNEVHINADVVFGVWHYFCATQDLEFLSKSLPLLLETTRYWISRVSFDKNGNVNLNAVMGPDEYICFCSNNSYTNTMVKKALMCTIKAIKLCDKNTEYFLSDEELAKVNLILEKLPILYDANGVLQQCAGFDEYEELDFDIVWQDKTKHFGSVVSQERNYRSKALKQADALMLPYLFHKEFTKEQVNDIYEKYVPFTTHDSSLSYIVHSIIKAHMGDAQESYKMFEKALGIDTAFGSAEGIHIANCGGIWQGVVFGFAGLSPAYECDKNSKPEFKPNLPSHWKKLEFPLIYNEKSYKICITHTECEIISS